MTAQSSISPPILWSVLQPKLPKQLTEYNKGRNLKHRKISKNNIEQFQPYAYFDRNCPSVAQKGDIIKIQNGTITNDPDFNIYSITSPLQLTNETKNEHFLGTCSICGLQMELKPHVNTKTKSVQFTHATAGNNCYKKHQNMAVPTNKEMQPSKAYFLITNYDVYTGLGKYLKSEVLSKLKKNAIKIFYNPIISCTFSNKKKKRSFNSMNTDSFNHNNHNNHHNNCGSKPAKRQKIETTPPLTSSDDEETNNDENDVKYNGSTSSIDVGDKNVRQKLNRFVLVAVIASGTFGKVMQIYDINDTSNHMAVKYITEPVMNSNWRRVSPSLIDREVDVMKQLNDEHVVKFYEEIKYEYGDKVHHHIILELMDQNLKLYLFANNPMNNEDKKQLYQIALVSICNGLKAIHKLGYVHSDIKPENILIHFGLNAMKIGDFGSVIHAASEYPQRVSPGFYNQLEKNGTGAVDHDFDKYSVDLFCLGMTLFSILDLNRSPLMFMKSVPQGDKHYYIVGRQSEIYVQCGKKSYIQTFGDAMIIIQKLIDPLFSNRIKLQQLFKLNYYKQAAKNRLLIPHTTNTNANVNTNTNSKQQKYVNLIFK